MAVPAAVVAAAANVDRLVADGRLSDATRQARVAGVRSQALVDQLTAALAVSHSVELGEWTITIDHVTVDPATSLVEMFGVTAALRGIDVRLDPHQQISLPPLLFPDPAGDVVRQRVDPDDGSMLEQRYRVDPAAVILHHLILQAARLPAARLLVP